MNMKVEDAAQGEDRSREEWECVGGTQATSEGIEERRHGPRLMIHKGNKVREGRIGQ